MNEFGVVGSVVLLGSTFPLAFWIARLCLEGVIRVLERR